MIRWGEIFVLPLVMSTLAMAAMENAPPAGGMHVRTPEVGDSRSCFSLLHGLIGEERTHRVQAKETLLDIARRYDLGFNELNDLYPQMDPWLPPRGETLRIPSRRILPEGMGEGLIVNLAEFRLYFGQKNGRILTFPISIGEKAWPTPEGTFAITDKIDSPTWVVPASLKHKYDFSTLPPGADNPLGQFWIRLGNSHFGIHGTDSPWSIGRAMTRGCIRLYPEDIQQLFPAVRAGTRVRIIYAPIKIVLHNERIFVEVHPDIYCRISNLYQYGCFILQKKGIVSRVDLGTFFQAIDDQKGIPVDITRPR